MTSRAGGKAFAPWADPDAQPLVCFEGVTKRFGDQTAVEAVDLSIYAGEFFALLGPSGCGKTTLMRLLAGFEAPDEGRILLSGTDLAGLPPHRRPVNMMFQSYALFPHLSVFDNVAFGLRMDAMSRPAMVARVDEMLALVKLEALAMRMPHQLSGGQRQRVALARALARRPKMLLLDEPMAALDKRLRGETQIELKALQAGLGTTFLVVTHDQDEAMALADRMAVMNAGRIVQIGTPVEVYEAPDNRFVADFVGDINIFEAKVETVEPPVAWLRGADGPLTVAAVDGLAPGSAVLLAVRPEKIRIGFGQSPGGSANVLRGEVRDVSYTGDWTNYGVELAAGRRIKVARANAERRTVRPIGPGDAVWVGFDADAGLVLK